MIKNIHSEESKELLKAVEASKKIHHLAENLNLRTGSSDGGLPNFPYMVEVVDFFSKNLDRSLFMMDGYYNLVGGLTIIRPPKFFKFRPGNIIAEIHFHSDEIVVNVYGDNSQATDLRALMDGLEKLEKEYGGSRKIACTYSSSPERKAYRPNGGGDPGF